jgi:polar amino acid transport system permease protein
MSIFLTIIIMTLSLILAQFLALARLSKVRWIRGPVTAYVQIIRGTPCLVQLYYIFYVFPFFGLTLKAIPAGIFGLTLNYAAYLSEVSRAAIQAIPTGQTEAATALNLSKTQTLIYVIQPQAWRIMLPPVINYLLGLLKDTSLLSLITIQELMFSGLLLGSVTFQYFTVLTMVALFYFAVCYPISIVADWIERKMRPEEYLGQAKLTRQTWMSKLHDTRVAQ